MQPIAETLSQIVHDAEVRIAYAKADVLDVLLVRLRRIVVEDIGRDVRAQLDPAPAFSDAALAAMEALAAETTPAPTHDPLDAPAAQPAVTTTPDPLDAPRPRRGGRRSRGSEGSPQAETPPETPPQPEPQPDDLDLPGEPLTVVEAGPAAEAAPSTDPVDALFGTPGDDFDPLA